MGQTVELPQDGLDRIGVWVTKGGSATTAALDVLLLEGGDPPHSAVELWQRHRGTWDARVRGAADPVEVVFPVTFELDDRAGRAFFLVVRQKERERGPAVALLTDGAQADHPAVRLLELPDQRIAPRPQGGALALSSGWVSSRPLRSLSWASLLLALLGLAALAFLRLDARSSLQAADGATGSEIGAEEVPSRSPVWDRLAWGWLVAVAGVVVVLFRDFGITWDEPIQSAYGQFLLHYYATWFPDAAVVDQVRLHDLYLYGGLFEWLAAAVLEISPLAPHHTRHLVNAGFGIIGLAGAWQLCRQLAGPRAGFLALIGLTLTPVFFGHMFANPKDIPFAAGFTWALALLVMTIRRWPRRRAAGAVAFGLVAGLTMAVRVGGIWLLALLPVAFVIRALWGPGAPSRARRVLEAIGMGVFIAPLVAWATMTFLWPWTHDQPLTKPILALLEFGRFSSYSETVLFDGRLVPASQLPLSYLPWSLFIKLPEGILLLLPVAAVTAILLLRRRRHLTRSGALSWVVVAAAGIGPVLLAVLSGAVLYDGMRHFLFVVPILWAAASFGADRALTLATSSHRLVGWGCGLAVGAAIAAPVWTMVKLHPYQYVYYNHVVGGLAGAAARYETDYWGASYSEAVQQLETALRRELGPSFAEHRFRVHACGAHAAAEAAFPPNFVIEPNVEAADFAIAITRHGCHRRAAGPVLLTVERLGIPLCYVYDRRARSRAQGGTDTGRARAGEL